MVGVSGNEKRSMQDDAVSRRELLTSCSTRGLKEEKFPRLASYCCGYLWCVRTCGLSLCFLEPYTKQVPSFFSSVDAIT
ncbi:hypothetical protein PsorP6_000979 [Peronosclerospora sorghi]|uniref:Uncharacterized protein n=1 Tax=Peronosclerospora sorghi TaxID=230839 RepID=A0ACC0WU92_9STRA|nr:hypothetical protein PsorP6_000979 [Peronosclerospora sorghi]